MLVMVNVSSPAYFDDCHVFRDAVKTAAYLPASPSYVSNHNGATNPSFDALGFPTSLAGDLYASGPWQTCSIPLGGFYGLSGTVTLSASGSGKFQFSFNYMDGTSQYTPPQVAGGASPTSYSFTFPKPVAGASLSWWATSDSLPGGHFRDLKVMLPDPDHPGQSYPANYSVDDATLYHDDFLSEYLLPDGVRFDALRFMDLQGTNGSPHADWSDVPLSTNSTQTYTYESDGGGFPWDVMLRMGTVLGVSAVWVCIPHLATDDFVTQFAGFLKANWPGDIYLEFSNEVWNPAFKQYRYACNTGFAIYHQPGEVQNASNEFGYGMRWYGVRAAECFANARAAFASDADPGRLKVVVGVTQAGTIVRAAYLAATGNVAPDFYSANGYYGAELSADPDCLANGTAYTLSRLGEGGTSAGRVTPGWEVASGFAQSDGCGWVIYEGGPGFTQQGSTPTAQAASLALMNSVNADPGIGPVVTYYFQIADGSGCSVFGYYSSTGLWGRFGAWGWKQNSLDVNAPKYAAVKDYVIDRPAALAPPLPASYVKSVALSSGSVSSSQTYTVTVTLNAAASSNVSVALSGTSAALNLPATLTVPSGQSSASAVVVAGHVAAATTATVTATLNFIASAAQVSLLAYTAPFHLNSSDSRASSVVAAYPFYEGSGDIVHDVGPNGYHLTPAHDHFTWAAGPDGSGLGSTAVTPTTAPAGSPYAYSGTGVANLAVPLPGSVTLAILSKCSAPAVQSANHFQLAGPIGPFHILEYPLDSSHAAIQVDYAFGQGQVNEGIGEAAGTWHAHVATFDATSWTIAAYHDGTAAGTSTIAAGNRVAQAFTQVLLGRPAASTTGGVALAIVANRVWTPQEIAAFAADPFGIFAGRTLADLIAAGDAADAVASMTPGTFYGPLPGSPARAAVAIGGKLVVGPLVDPGSVVAGSAPSGGTALPSGAGGSSSRQLPRGR